MFVVISFVERCNISGVKLAPMLLFNRRLLSISQKGKVSTQIRSNQKAIQRF